MSATALPESGHESESQEISLPFGLYFGALNCPHWSSYNDNDPKARRDAASVRSVERDRRMREVRRLHEKVHQAKHAADSLVALDATGFTEAAAGHLEVALQNLVNEAKQVIGNMRADAAGWIVNGQAAMAELDDAADQGAGEDLPVARPYPTPAEVLQSIRHGK
ncbi:hypothetical protein [Arthrobacter sp. B1805]|uniref:hypothetical protein n=1 Tax=Arthrobacter sp. B1805 TaxID=2058892 RepID=UPI000CE4DDEC|nr:hypothetical protein [Arthrobacter sp. B1805]